MDLPCALAFTSSNAIRVGGWARLLLCLTFTFSLGALAQDDAAASSSAPVGDHEWSTSATEESAEALEKSDSGITDRELSMDVGKLTLYPILNTGLGYSTNVYNSEGETEDAPWVSLRLGGGVQGENRNHLYGAEYMAERMWYLSDDIPDDEEFMHRLVAYWGTAFDSRNNLDLGVEYLDAFDRRGQDDPRRDARRATTADEADTWTQLSYGGTYGYGTAGARGRLELSACVTCREYDNNGQEYRDRDVFDVGGTLFTQLTGRTDGFIQVVYSDFDYVDQGPDDPTEGRSLDSEEWRYTVGATWVASEKTSGMFRVGQVDKTFDDPSRSDYQELTWDLLANWTPGSRDRVSLAYFRSPRETLQWQRSEFDVAPPEGDELLDDFIEVEDLSLDWSHQLGSSAQLNLGGYVGRDHWQPSDRKDDLWGATVGFRYSFRQWGSIGVSYFHRERDSSDPINDYSDDGIYVDINIGSIFGFGDSRAPAICLLRSYSSGNNGYAGY